MQVTITVPLASLPGVEVEWRHEHEYDHPEVTNLPLTDLALEFTGEVTEHFPRLDEVDAYRHREDAWDIVQASEGTFKLGKPRLVIG